jgi:hypothetical protein
VTEVAASTVKPAIMHCGAKHIVVVRGRGSLGLAECDCECECECDWLIEYTGPEQLQIVNGSFCPRFTAPFKEKKRPIKALLATPVMLPGVTKTPRKLVLSPNVALTEARQKILHACVPFAGTMIADVPVVRAVTKKMNVESGFPCPFNVIVFANSNGLAVYMYTPGTRSIFVIKEALDVNVGVAAPN